MTRLLGVLVALVGFVAGPNISAQDDIPKPIVKKRSVYNVGLLHDEYCNTRANGDLKYKSNIILIQMVVAKSDKIGETLVLSVTDDVGRRVPYALVKVAKENAKSFDKVKIDDTIIVKAKCNGLFPDSTAYRKQIVHFEDGMLVGDPVPPKD